MSGTHEEATMVSSEDPEITRLLSLIDEDIKHGRHVVSLPKE